MKNRIKTYEIKGESVQLYDYEVQALHFLSHQKMVTADQFLQHLVGFHEANLDVKLYEERLTYLWHSHLVEVGNFNGVYFVLISEEASHLLKEVNRKGTMNTVPLNTHEEISNHLHIQQIIVEYFNLVRSQLNCALQPNLTNKQRSIYLSLPLFVGGDLVSFHPNNKPKLDVGQSWIFGRMYNGETPDHYIHFHVISNNEDPDELLSSYYKIQELNKHEIHRVIFVNFADVMVYDLKELNKYERRDYKEVVKQMAYRCFSELIQDDLLTK